MSREIFYKKVGRKYVPVYEYDQTLMDSFPKGTHIIMCYPGGVSRRYNIEPNHAALIAASRVAEEAMSQAIVKASEMRPNRTPITEGQRRAWRKLAKEFGDDLATLNTSSARDIAEAGIKAIMDEAEKLMEVPSVKKAYEHLMLVAELTKDNK